MFTNRTDEAETLGHESERLAHGLDQCRAVVEHYRSRLAANANDAYRPPYNSETTPSELERLEAEVERRGDGTSV